MTGTAIGSILIAGALATAGAVAVNDIRSGKPAETYEERLIGSGNRDELDPIDPRDSDREHEFSIDVSGPGMRERFGVRVDEDTPSVTVDAGNFGRGSFQVRRDRDDDDEDDDDGNGDDDNDRRDNIRNRDRDREDGRSGRRDTGSAGIAIDYGFNDGYDRGLQDGRDRARYDPVRHRAYRSADRGYDSRCGSREEYRIAYREGFKDGYERGHRDGERSEGTRSDRWPWPF